MVWAGMGCLIVCINSIIWRGNAVDWAPAWCEICEHPTIASTMVSAIKLIIVLASRLFVSVSIGLPAASLCINRRLYHIASVRSVTISKAEKHRDVTIDLAIGLGIPILYQICCKCPHFYVL